MDRTLATVGLAFDVAGVLGIGAPSPKPVKGTQGFITLRIPDGISPRSLRQSKVGKERIWEDTWYDIYDWADQSLPAGVYHLRLPIPDSNRKTFEEQKALLLKGEEIAPLALVELALLCCRKAGQPDPLSGDWVRCRETADGYRVGLDWDDARLCADGYCDDSSDGSVWLASARTS